MGARVTRAKRKGIARKGAKRGQRALRRTFKDSVFCDLFSRPRYALGLYRGLHPEDEGATEGDVEIVTIENVIVDAPYNDVGLAVGDRVMVLAEAQSTWTPNVAIRGLLYYAQTLSDWVHSHGVDLCRGEAVRLPRPELCVAYTGGGRVPADVALRRDFPGLSGSVVDARVRVLTGGGAVTPSEYVEFCRVGDECRRAYGRTREAARATVEECLRRGILVEYLRERGKEVEDMLAGLYDQEEAMRIHDVNVRRETQTTERLEVARRMIRHGGLPIEDIASLSGVSPEEVARLAGELGAPA